MSEVVLMHLVKSYCLPCMYYSFEIIAYNNKCYTDLNRCTNLVIYKIFKVSDASNIEYIKQIFGIDNANLFAAKRLGKFYCSIRDDSNLKKLMFLYNIVWICISEDNLFLV